MAGTKLQQENGVKGWIFLPKLHVTLVIDSVLAEHIRKEVKCISVKIALHFGYIS